VIAANVHDLAGNSAQVDFNLMAKGNVRRSEYQIRPIGKLSLDHVSAKSDFEPLLNPSIQGLVAPIEPGHLGDNTGGFSMGKRRQRNGSGAKDVIPMPVGKDKKHRGRNFDFGYVLEQ
jgi:hypothetical protein